MGLGGGVLRRGQVHGELDALSGAFALSEGGVSDASHAVSGLVVLHAWIVSPTVGKFLVIMPSAVQVFPAQEEFVRVTCHIHELSTFEGCTGRRPAREPEEDSTHDLDTIVVHGVHLHGDWDQISLTQAKATDNLYAS